MALSRPGLLDQRVALTRVTRVPDGAGGFDEEWMTVATAWASIRPKSGSEAVAAMQAYEATTYDVVMRSRVDVRSTDRLKWSGRTLKIDSAPPPGRDLYRALVAVEYLVRGK